jgi:uncharacterized repeat protein (TIGR01451 family)
MAVSLSSDAARFVDGTLLSESAWAVADGGASGVAEASVVVSSSPVLGVAIRSDRDPVRAGELLRYAVTFSNPATTDLSGVTLRAQLPVGALLQDASDDGTMDFGSVTWAVGSVRAGQSGQRQFTVQVPEAAVDGDVLDSEAEIHEPSTGGSARATSATTVRNNAPMAFALSASPDPVRRGGLLTYRLTVTNRTASPLNNVTLAAVTPDGTDNIHLSDGGSCPSGCSTGRIASWSLGSLAGGASRTVEMAVSLSSDATPFVDGTLLSESAWAVADGGASGVAEASVVVSSSPVLGVAIRSDRDPVGPGDVLTYTLGFGNPDILARTDVTLRAQVPIGAVLDNVSDGGTLDGDSVTWTLGGLPAGQSGRRRFAIRVPAAAADGDILRSDAEILDAGTHGAARATSATTVRRNAPMALALSASPDPVRRGGVLTYQVTVTNHTASALNNVMLSTVTPDGASSIHLSDEGGCTSGCSPGRFANWSLESLAGGASRTVSMTMSLSNNANQFPDGTLISNRAWGFADGGASASAEAEARICAAGGTACDSNAATPTFTPKLNQTITATPSNTPGVTPTQSPLNTPSVTPTSSVTPAIGPCIGDCNGDRIVTVNELITMVNIALGNASVSTCRPGDADGSGDIAINEIIAAVKNALNGCPTV